MSVNDFLLSIVASIIASVIFSLVLIYLVQSYRYKRHLEKKFHNKSFKVHYKGFPNEVVREVVCTVQRNRIKYEGKGNAWDGTFRGEFIMNPINLRVGNGLHIHDENEGFNFPSIIIKDDNTFLIETSYIKMEVDAGTKKKGVVYPQAFIWRKD